MSNLCAPTLHRVRGSVLFKLWGFSRVSFRHYTVKVGEESAHRRVRPLAHTATVISTVTPSLLKTSDYLDLSQKGSLSIRFPVCRTPSGEPGLRYSRDEVGLFPFPDHTRGFLYYHADPHATPLEGSIRFRLTADNSPSSFPGGEDLVSASGFPWQVTLAQVACTRNYSWIADQLVHENLVTREQLSRFHNLFDQRTFIYPQFLLFRLDSTFLVDFSNAVTLTAIGERVHKVKMSALFAVRERDQIYPWTGSALARFESSTLPKYAGRRVLHMRFLKIVKPVACSVDSQRCRGRIIRPEEGQLHTVSHYGRPPEPWAYDIDGARAASQPAAALRVLWEASRPS
ncbi:hypothetical protein FB451DRAFT_1273222 [Mycena latifolia]|nr:hypothetical protein FB451DRAFT_1273222 [Mycena latifolia]